MRTLVALVVLVVLAGCGRVDPSTPSAGPDTRFYYDLSGRLAAVQQGGTTAVYRFDAAGNRVAVDHVRSRGFDPQQLRPRAQSGPKVSGVSPRRVAQGATVVISGTGFDPDPVGNVVAVGGALGRVLRADPRELRVQLPPVAVPGPVSVSTAHGHATSEDDLVVVPAEVDPAEVRNVVAVDIGSTTTLDSGPALLTFHGTAGSTVELHLESEDSGGDGCDVADVGLAGPTGTIIEAKAGEASWCDRPARLPMTGTYTATVTHAGGTRATLAAARPSDAKRLPDKPVVAAKPQAWDSPPTDGPPDFPVDLSSGLMATAVTDLALGGSGAVDLTRTFSVGDLDLPAVAPEEPLARHWSLAGSIALEPSMSNSYLDLVLPDGRRLPYQRVTGGAPEPTGAVFEPSPGVGSGPFAGSRVAYTGSGWELRTRTDTVLGFGRTGSPLRLSWLRDPAGRTARFVRAPDDTDGSPDGDLVGVVSESGQWARFTHDEEGRITAATDQVGDRVTYRYGRPERVFADVLTKVTYQRAGGRPTAVGYRYQPLTGRLAAVTDGRRDRVRFDYDDAGRVTRERVLRPAAPGDVAGEWRYAYSVGTRRVTIPGRSGSVALPQIDRVTVSGPGGRRTVRLQDGRWVTDTSAAGTVRVARQPGTGLITSVRVQRPGVAELRRRFAYDSNGRLVDEGSDRTDTRGSAQIRGPGGVPAGDASSGAAAVFVDARGRVAARRTPEGAVARIGYDSFDRPTSITDPGGATTRLSYTRAGDLASVTDGAGTTRYSWNDAGQQTAETDPLGGRQRWRYDRAGRLVWSRDARGVESTFGYDSAGRLVVARFGVRAGKVPESLVRYGYDSIGRLTKVHDSADGAASLRYDAHGHLVAETTGAGTVTEAYDEDGNRTGLTLPGGSSARYSYDADGALSRLSLGGGSKDVRVVPSYDDRGRLSGLDLPDGIRGRFDYTGGQVSRLTYSRNGRALAGQRAAHDNTGRIVGLSGDLGRTTLPAEQSAAQFDDAHQLVSQSTSDSARAWRWDRAGNLLQDGTRRYTWDARGRLVAVAGPEGRTTYGYDALGRRTTATTDGKTVRYVYDGGDVVQRVAADGTRTTYLRGPDGTPLASTTDGAAGTTALLPDMFGNVGGAVTADGTSKRFSYDPFGAPGDPAAGADVPGFRGLLTDPSGQLAMGSRTYSPTTGRFLSRDSWGIEGGDTDPYRYALGAPTVYTDPSGHAAECVGMALGWAMSVLGPGGGWDDYDALEDKVDSGQISQDEWAVQADRVSHDLWAGFDVVANVCGTSAVGSSAAALPLLGASKVTSRVLGSLADDAVAGAAATRVGNGFGRVAPGVGLRARAVLERLLRNYESGVGSPTGGIANAKFAQRWFSERFSEDGAFTGRRIDDVATALRSGDMTTKEVPINVIIRDGTMLITNTRSAQALIRAGIPRDLWNVTDRTGDALYERLLSAQLRRNRLGSSGIELP